MRGVLAVPLLFAACAQRDEERPFDLEALHAEYPELRGFVTKASEVRDSFPPLGPHGQIVRVFGPVGAAQREWHPGLRLSDLRPSKSFRERQVVVLRVRRVIVADLRANEDLALWPGDAVFFRKVYSIDEPPIWSFIMRAIVDPDSLDTPLERSGFRYHR